MGEVRTKIYQYLKMHIDNNHYSVGIMFNPL